MVPAPPFPRLALPLFVAATGAAALGALALVRALSRPRRAAVVRASPPAAMPRTTEVLECDGPLIEATRADVPW